MTSENNATLCKFCGAIVENDGIEINGFHFCDDECAERFGYRKCNECGEWLTPYDGIEIGNERYCSNVCAHDAGYEECERCGEWVKSTLGTWVDDDTFFCSERCAETRGWFRCERCDDWERSYYGGWVYTSCYGEQHWCDACYEDDSGRCEVCGESWDLHDLNNDYRCPDCHEERSEYLHEYGYCPSIEFFGKESDTPFLGVELETDGGYDREDYCDELHCIDGFPRRFWMTEDSSLCNGVEITSQPMTLAEHVRIMGTYETIGDTARRFGFGSHNGGRCGLHVHVSRSFFGKGVNARDAGGYKMMRLLQRFEGAFMVFSRRTNDDWCRYKTNNDYTPVKTQAKILSHPIEPSMLTKAQRMKHERSHSQALNFQHRDTFEFRIFRGTLKWTTYYACLGLVNGMCHVAKNHSSIWVEDVDWYTLIAEVVERCDEPYARECLENYLDEKGLR